MAVSLIALIAKTGERFNADIGAPQVVTGLREGLLSVGVVAAFRAITETFEGNPAFCIPVVIAVGRTEAQRQGTVLAQGIGSHVQAVEIAVEAAAVQSRFGFATQHTDSPLLIDAPIRAQYQALC
ncbi:hypothetical protein D3C84_1003740 [compost metagenome]